MQLLWRKFYFSLKTYSKCVDRRMAEISKARLKVFLHNFSTNKHILFSDVLLKCHCSENKLISEDRINFPTEYSKVVFAPTAGYQNIFTRTSRLKNTCLGLQDLHVILYTNRLI